MDYTTIHNQFTLGGNTSARPWMSEIGPLVLWIIQASTNSSPRAEIRLRCPWVSPIIYIDLDLSIHQQTIHERQGFHCAIPGCLKSYSSPSALTNHQHRSLGTQIPMRYARLYKVLLPAPPPDSTSRVIPPRAKLRMLFPGCLKPYNYASSLAAHKRKAHDKQISL